MTKWLLKCKKCNTLWVLDVSYDLNMFKELYHYCHECKENTFHEILGTEFEDSSN